MNWSAWWCRCRRPRQNCVPILLLYWSRNLKVSTNVRFISRHKCIRNSITIGLVGRIRTQRFGERAVLHCDITSVQENRNIAGDSPHNQSLGRRVCSRSEPRYFGDVALPRIHERFHFSIFIFIWNSSSDVGDSGIQRDNASKSFSDFD